MSILAAFSAPFGASSETFFPCASSFLYSAPYLLFIATISGSTASWSADSWAMPTRIAATDSSEVKMSVAVLLKRDFVMHSTTETQERSSGIFTTSNFQVRPRSGRITSPLVSIAVLVTAAESFRRALESRSAGVDASPLVRSSLELGAWDLELYRKAVPSLPSSCPAIMHADSSLTRSDDFGARYFRLPRF